MEDLDFDFDTDYSIDDSDMNLEMQEISSPYDNSCYDVENFDCDFDSINSDSDELQSDNNDFDTDTSHNEISFKGYTKSEIDKKIAHAESETRRYEGLFEHHKYMAKHGLDKADTEYHLNKVREFQNRANECAAEANKWRYTKPDKK